MKDQNRQVHRQNRPSGHQGLGEGRRGKDCEQTTLLLGVIEMFWNWIMAMLLQPCGQTQTCGGVSCQGENFHVQYLQI